MNGIASQPFKSQSRHGSHIIRIIPQHGGQLLDRRAMERSDLFDELIDVQDAAEPCSIARVFQLIHEMVEISEFRRVNTLQLPYCFLLK